MRVNYHLREKLRILRPLVTGKRVLDVGCAGGWLNMNSPDWLHKHIELLAGDSLGVDNNESAVMQMAANGYKVVWGDASDYDFGGGEWDVIFAGELVEHLANVGQFMACSRRALRTGGYLIITTPSAVSPLRWPSVLRGNTTETHYCWYDESTLSLLGRAYGFEVVKTCWLRASRGNMANPLVWWIETLRPAKVFRRDMLMVLQKDGREAGG